MGRREIRAALLHDGPRRPHQRALERLGHDRWPSGATDEPRGVREAGHEFDQLRDNVVALKRGPLN
jgi:hypothetical protein